MPLTIKIIKVDPSFNFAEHLQFFTLQIIDSIYSYKFPKEQVIKFCSELLKRYYLADVVAASPNNLDIIYNKYDKPFLISRTIPVNPERSIIEMDARQSLHSINEKLDLNLEHKVKFNISHAKDYVAIAVIDNPDYELGVDIEYINRNSTDFREMAKIVYSDFEISQIKDADDFFNFWTKKESLIKARGTGFGEEFYKTTQLSLDDYIQDTNYSIYTTLFENDYYLSVCLLKTHI